jgi:hypothetical protein
LKFYLPANNTNFSRIKTAPANSCLFVHFVEKMLYRDKVQTDVPANKEKRISGKRIGAVISLLIIVPTGFYGKFYSGPAAAWVNDSLGGTFYEIFWCLLIFLFFVHAAPWRIAVSVLTVTCLLEVLQLWHPPFLEVIRSHFIGRTILGTFFVWSDFPYYFLGTWIGWLWIRQLKNIGERPSGRAQKKAGSKKGEEKMVSKVICLFAAGLMLAAVTGLAEESEPEKAAVAAAGQWLRIVDEEKYSESWKEAAGYFRNAVKQEQWESAVQAIRKPLGKLVSREVKSTAYKTALSGVPDGEYVIIQFETSFENKQSAIETVTPMMDKDGTWRVSGYYIK